MNQPPPLREIGRLSFRPVGADGEHESGAGGRIIRVEGVETSTRLGPPLLKARKRTLEPSQ